MKFLVRSLPNGRILVKIIDFDLFIQPNTFDNMSKASEFMQKTIDSYGASNTDFSDPTGVQSLFGEDNDS